MRIKVIFAVAVPILCMSLLLAGCQGKKNGDMNGNMSFDDMEGESAVDLTAIVEAGAYSERKTNSPDAASAASKTERTSGKQEFDDDYGSLSFDLKASDYVTDCVYAGLMLRDPGLAEVTDSDVEAKVMQAFEDYDTGTYAYSGPAETGKAVAVSVEYSMPDGEKAGVSERTKLGGGTLPQEIEEALVGLKAGSEFGPVTFTYPEDGDIPLLRGTETTASGILTEVREYRSVSDQSIAEMTNQRYVNLDTYRKHVREELEFNAEDNRWRALADQTMAFLMENLEISGYPEKELNEMTEAVRAAYTDEDGNLLYSEEEIKADAESQVAAMLALLYVAEKESIEITETDCVQAAQYRRRVAEIETPEDWDAYLSEYGKESVLTDALYLKVMNRLIDGAVILAPRA